MKTGSARVEVSPLLPVALAGRGGDKRVAEVAASGLEANAVVFQNEDKLVALVSVDTLFCSAAFKKSVSTEYEGLAGRKIDGLFLIASHTHHAPSLDPEKTVLGEVDPTYFSNTSRAVAACIRDSQTSAKAGLSVEQANTRLSANARRRRKTLRLSRHWPWFSWTVCLAPLRDVEVPCILDVMVVKDGSENICACLWTWPCHATTFPHSRQVSADYPGAVRITLRRLLGIADLPILFLPGFAGDLGCDVARQPVSKSRRLMTPLVRPFADTTDENFVQLTEELAKAAGCCVKHLKPITENHGFRLNCTEVPIASLMEGETSAATIEINHLGVGPLDILLLGAEVCSPWAEVLRLYVGQNTILSGYCNDIPCYLPTSAQVEEGGYEADGFRHSFGLKGNFAHDMQERITAAVRTLASTPQTM